ncbi:hypothetical protein [Modicisalibacter luteus]|uniref:Uncharacterized protein n=1 Tax=Modicisalibacter luteus TaxID=453962 RepID=A0ABV7M4N5_9GAMM|nr:hypothetical protein [Halomonas lutea]GHA85432.1 hypothetical protein GCM10007159_03170 [Halomonas lutea]
MPTIREQVIAALAQRLGAQRANTVIEALPARSLWDSNDSDVERADFGQMAVTMTLTLETVHQADNDPGRWSEQGNAILGQLIIDATGQDVTLSGLCDDIAYAGGTIYYPEDGSEVIGVDINLAVRFRFDVGDPFTNSM